MPHPAPILDVSDRQRWFEAIDRLLSAARVGIRVYLAHSDKEDPAPVGAAE